VTFVKTLFRHLGFLLISAVVTTIIATFLQTQRVIGNLSDIGVSVSLWKRLGMSFYDITHLGTIYIIFITLALLGAFLTSGIVFHFVKFGRSLIYVIAGAIAIFVMLMLMKRAFFDVHLIAGARDGAGIMWQMLAGAIGGFTFARLTRSRNAPIRAVMSGNKDEDEALA